MSCNGRAVKALIEFSRPTWWIGPIRAQKSPTLKFCDGGCEENRLLTCWREYMVENLRWDDFCYYFG